MRACALPNKQDGTSTLKTFVHSPSMIEAEEAEEIGVEHLLRDVRDAAVGVLSTRITSQIHSLHGLQSRLANISDYLGDVVAGKQPLNHRILNTLQDVFNLLPNLSPGNESDGLSKESGLPFAFSVKANDQLMCVYLSSLIRAIIAFHDLIENKIQNKCNDNASANVDMRIERQEIAR